MQTALQREYTAAKEAGRAGEAFEVWREGMLTQAGAAWLLSGVFVRFLEDNGLVNEAFLSGPGERRDEASERQMQYFQRHPTDSDRDYLYDVFRTVQALPAVVGLFDDSHNPIWVYGISWDAAKELIDFWRRRVPETGDWCTTSPTDLEYALPGRLVPGSVGGGAQTLRPVADPLIRRGVHPRPHAGACHCRVWAQRSPAHRSHLWLGAFFAGGLPAHSGQVGASRALHAGACRGPTYSGRRLWRGCQSLRRGNPRFRLLVAACRPVESSG